MVGKGRHELPTESASRRGPRLREKMSPWRTREGAVAGTVHETLSVGSGPIAESADDRDVDSDAALQNSSVAAVISTEDSEESESVDYPVDVDVDDDEAEPDNDADESEPRRGRIRSMVAAGIALVMAMAGLSGWLGFRAFESHEQAQRQAQFLEVGRQGAINLTTIDFRTVDSDIQRVLDSTTGAFHDDFQSRSGSFIEAVKHAQSVTEGSVNDAGIESEEGDGAVVLVSVSVTTLNNAAPEQKPRSWRMRIYVNKVGDDMKVSNVEFVV